MKFLNPHDLVLIAVVVVLTHFAMQPIYRIIDNSTAN